MTCMLVDGECLFESVYLLEGIIVKGKEYATNQSPRR